MNDEQTLDQRLTDASRELAAFEVGEPPLPLPLPNPSHRPGARRATVALVLGAAAVATAFITISNQSTRNTIRVTEGPSTATGHTSPSNQSEVVSMLCCGKWAGPYPSPLSPRVEYALTVAAESVFVWGGQAPNGLLADGAVFDLASASWAKVPPSPLSPRRSATAIAAGNVVLVGGGIVDGRRFVNTFALYDITKEVWSEVAPLPDVLIPDALVDSSTYLANGIAIGDTIYLPQLGVQFSVASKTWEPAPALDPTIEDVRFAPAGQGAVAAGLGAGHVRVFEWTGTHGPWRELPEPGISSRGYDIAAVGGMVTIVESRAGVLQLRDGAWTVVKTPDWTDVDCSASATDMSGVLAVDMCTTLGAVLATGEWQTVLAPRGELQFTAVSSSGDRLLLVSRYDDSENSNPISISVRSYGATPTNG